MALPLNLDQNWYYPLASFALIELTGNDRQRFLHNQTTNAIEGVTAGQWLETVFVNSTGRTLELATVYAQENALWLQVGGDRRQFLLEWMDRYIFPFDKVQLKDLSDHYRAIVLVGSNVTADLEQRGLTVPQGQEHQTVTWQGVEVLISGQTGLDLPGCTLLVPTEALGEIEERFKSYQPLDGEQWQQLRVYQGRPQAGQELTEDYNPLEAGLWRAISFTKGCYIGQETIARLNTYQGVKQRLWRLQLTEEIEPGAVVSQDGQKVGVVTSVSGLTALAYLKTKLVAPATTVTVGDSTAMVEPAPYLSHDYYQPAS